MKRQGAKPLPSSLRPSTDISLAYRLSSLNSLHDVHQNQSTSSVSSGSIILKRSQAVTSLTLKRSSSRRIYSGKRLCFARCLTSGSLLISFSGRKPSRVACCTVQRCASDRWSKGISEASRCNGSIPVGLESTPRPPRTRNSDLGPLGPQTRHRIRLGPSSTHVVHEVHRI